MIKFSMIPSGHFPQFLSSVLMITTSPTAGVSPPAPYCARCLLRRLRKYSLVHRLHTASLHFSKCFARFRRSAVSMWCGCNSGSKLLFKNNIAFSVRRGICTISTSSRTSCNSFHHSRPFPIVLFRADLTRPINLSNYPPHHRVRLRLNCHLIWLMERYVCSHSSFMTALIQFAAPMKVRLLSE